MNDSWPRRFVWSVYVVALILLVWSFARLASPVPIAEDWLAVAPLTGHEPSLASWLWSQNNEHRMPVARLVILGALTAAGGDFRAGGFASLLLLAGTAAGLMAFVRAVRGRTDWSDAFFPLLLLHFGHSNQVLFTWQLTSLLAILFVVAMGCALHAPASLSSPVSAGVAGVMLLVLPLSGFMGLFFVPPTLAFVLYVACACEFGWRGWPRRRGVARWLMTACAGSAALTLVYFVGYEHPWWNPPNPGVLPSIKTALKVLSLSFGPAAELWWPPAIAGAILVTTASHWQAARRILQNHSADRDRAIGAAMFLGIATLFALAVGWGRAGDVPRFGIPLRYVVIALPAAVGAYLTWAVVPSARGQLVSRALMLAMLLLLPANHVAGQRLFADWYRDGTQRVEADIVRQWPIEQLAAQHQPFLVHWWTPAELARHMRMLRDAGLPPFQSQ